MICPCHRRGKSGCRMARRDLDPRATCARQRQATEGARRGRRPDVLRRTAGRRNEMSIERVFLDWKRPALAAAVDWLIERFSAAGQLDLQKVVLALPGGRGRPAVAGNPRRRGRAAAVATLPAADGYCRQAAGVALPSEAAVCRAVDAATGLDRGIPQRRSVSARGHRPETPCRKRSRRPAVVG